MMMGVMTPRYGMLTVRRDSVANGGTSYPYGRDDGIAAAGTTLPESAELLSLQVVGECTRTGDGEVVGQIWKNDASSLVFATPSIFMAQTEWRRQTVSTSGSSALGKFKGEETGTPDEIIGDTSFTDPMETGTLSYVCTTIHLRYLLDDFAASGPVGITRPRHVVISAYRERMNSTHTEKPWGGDSGSSAEGTTPPTTTRWNRSQIVANVITPGSGGTETLSGNSFKNADDGSADIFSSSVSTVATSPVRASSMLVIDAGSEGMIGEDAFSAADELLASMDLITTGGVIDDITMTLHGEFLP